MNSTQDLSQLLDALEAGLLQLQTERNELREALGRAGGTKTTKKAAKKAVKKAVKAPQPKETAAPKEPPKTRVALGRTLTMIRSPRPSNG